jgi:hypothetical protein
MSIRCLTTSAHLCGQGDEAPGVFLIPQKLDVAEAIDALLLIWLASDAEEWENRLEWLPL